MRLPAFKIHLSRLVLLSLYDLWTKLIFPMYYADEWSMKLRKILGKYIGNSWILILMCMHEILLTLAATNPTVFPGDALIINTLKSDKMAAIFRTTFSNGWIQATLLCNFWSDGEDFLSIFIVLCLFMHSIVKGYLCKSFKLQIHPIFFLSNTLFILITLLCDTPVELRC